MSSEKTKNEIAAAEIFVLSERLTSLLRMAQAKEHAFQAIGMAIGNLATRDISIDKSLKLISGVARATAWTKHGTDE